jgi:hypothetical protein
MRSGGSGVGSGGFPAAAAVPLLLVLPDLGCARRWSLVAGGRRWGGTHLEQIKVLGEGVALHTQLLNSAVPRNDLSLEVEAGGGRGLLRGHRVGLALEGPNSLIFLLRSEPRTAYRPGTRGLRPLPYSPATHFCCIRYGFPTVRL